MCHWPFSGTLIRPAMLLAGGATLAFVPICFTLLSWMSRPASDFEECVEQIDAKAPPEPEKASLMTDCNARFAGRRKATGGYTYYDFILDRKFDLAGPNPTPQERQQLDQAYMTFLDSRRRDTIASELARISSEQLRVDLEKTRQAVGPPLVLTPKKIPSSKESKVTASRSSPSGCEDSSFSCGWANLSTAVKRAFAQSGTGKSQLPPEK